MKIYCSRGVNIDQLIGKDIWFKFKINYITDNFSWVRLLDKRYDDRYRCECYVYNLVSDLMIAHHIDKDISVRKTLYNNVTRRERVTPVTEIDTVFNEGLADKDLMTTEELFGIED